MASLTIGNTQQFPPGTTLGAYLASAWPQGKLPPGFTGAPVVAATATATQGTSGATFTGLADGTRYFIAGQVGGVWVYIDSITTLFVGGDTLLYPERFGATGDGVTDDTAAFNAMSAVVSTLPASDWLASGARIVLGAKTYVVNGWVIPKTQARLRIDGASKRGTTLMRTANVTMLDISGDADSNAGQIKNVTVANLRLASSQRQVGVWTAMAVRCYYAQFVHWENVDFYRFGGRAIAGVRYYDGQFFNCRIDYCGAAGHPAVHMKCSEAGAAPATFGYSTDSCNNLYFANCTWEQNPGTDLFFDGSQSDGTFNASRRINMCRLEGCKMENQVPAERSDDARLRMENVSHITIGDGLVVSANGTASGNATDWFVLKKGYNVLCSHYTAVGTESTPNGMRTGLRLEDTVGATFGKVVGSVQTTQKPSVALVEFAGSNTLCDPSIAKTYYDNNPGAAKLFSGSAASWVDDPHEGRVVVPAWTIRATTMTTRALTGLTEYMLHFRVKVPTVAVGLKFVVTTAALSDDGVDVAIRTGNLGNGSLIASKGGQTGKINSTGVKEVDFATPAQLDPGVDYYATVMQNTTGSTAATLLGVGDQGALTTPHQIQGTGAPDVEWTSVAASTYPIPANSGTPNSGLNSTAALWLVRG